MWKLWALAAAILAGAGCAKDEGCATDNDCKGERICDAQLRLCVDRAPGAAPDLSMPVADPSGLDLCRAGCDASRRCGTLSDTQAAACRVDCDARQPGLEAEDTAADQRCARAGELRRQRLACLGLPCNQINSCTQQIDQTICSTREPPVPAACVGGAPAGARYQFATSAIKIPTTVSRYAIDIDGDGRLDNQLKAIVGAIASANFDLQGPIEEAVKSGELVLLPDLQAQDLTNGCAHVVVAVAQKPNQPPKYDGTDVFTINNGVAPAALAGVFAAGSFTTMQPQDLMPGAVPVLRLTLPFASGALPLTLYGAHISATAVSPGGVMSGEIHGVVRKADIDGQIVPAVAQLLTNQIRREPMSSTTETIIRLFEDQAGNPASKDKCTNTPAKCCATPANRSTTCEILTAEVSANPLIGNVLAPDVQVFQGARWSPVPKGSAKDAMSVGLGFTAVRATWAR